MEVSGESAGRVGEYKKEIAWIGDKNLKKEEKKKRVLSRKIIFG